MNRRNILRSTSALVTATTVGLAGCLGGDDGGGDDGGGDDDGSDDGGSDDSGSDDGGSDDSGSDDGGSDGGNSSCEVPNGDLKDYFPDSGDYTLQNQIRVIEESSIEGVEREASAFYDGPDGEMTFQITEYSSETIAAEETDTVSEQGSGYAGSVGYIQTGAYITSAIGADESSVKAILKATPLSDGCVDDNVEFA